MAVVLLVLLRISIGWQFLYEGLWKWDTWDTAKPWTSRGFLVNAKGPFRDFFRDQMAGDPDDLEWLAYDKPYEGSEEKVPFVEMKWDDWLLDFSYHYDLSDAEYGRLSRRIRGREFVTSDEFEMPFDVEITGRLANLVQYDEEQQKLVLQTAVIDSAGYWHPKRHLVPRDRQALLNLVPDVAESSPGVFGSRDQDFSHEQFAEQVHLLYQRQANLTYFERLRAMLFGDPDWATVEIAENESRLGKIDQYKQRLEQYEKSLAEATTPYERDVLEYEWKEIQELKIELVGPIKALEAEMKQDAYNTLTTEQRAKGPMPEPMTPQRTADVMAVVSLLVLGGLLILGLFTRLAAFMGAGMVTTFYLVWPPFPGVPEAPGPEHALIVNKNFIEAMALLALAFLPTGTWFGVDGAFGALFRGGGKSKSQPKAEEKKSEAKSEPEAEKAAVTPVPASPSEAAKKS